MAGSGDEGGTPPETQRDGVEANSDPGEDSDEVDEAGGQRQTGTKVGRQKGGSIGSPTSEVFSGRGTSTPPSPRRRGRRVWARTSREGGDENEVRQEEAVDGGVGSGSSSGESSTRRSRSL